MLSSLFHYLIKGVEMRQCMIQSAQFNSFHPHTYLYLSSFYVFLVGATCNQSARNNYDNERVNEGDEWSMEVDLRSEEKEKRTLHWFVRGKQQKGFIYGVPDRVEFAV